MAVTTGPRFKTQADAIGVQVRDVVGAFPSNHKVLEKLGKFGTIPYTFKDGTTRTTCTVTYKKDGDDWVLTDIKKA